MKKNTFLLPFALLVAACAPPAPAPVGPVQPVIAPPGLPTTAQVYAVETGWHNNQPVRYYNFGVNTTLDALEPTRVLVEPVWVFITGFDANEAPVRLAGQGSLFATSVGAPDYSDLWQVHAVTAPADYPPDTLRSVSALTASGWPVERLPMLVNCPFVPPGSRLADDALPLLPGWVAEQPVAYFDFGVTRAQPGNVYVWVNGLGADGQPDLAANAPVIFDSKRGDPNYSDFRRVHWVQVGGNLNPASVRSASDLPASAISATDLIVNYPQK